MRALGAAYTTALGEPVSRPCARVWLANHGGAFADPLEVTDHVASVELARPLRSGNSARITLHSEDGQFSPVGGIYAAAVRARNAQVRIEMGEILAGVPTYWRVMTGTIVECKPSHGRPLRTVVLFVTDLADLWTNVQTSPAYQIREATPVYWTAFQVLADLLEKFGGFTWPDDFALDALSDWDIVKTLQFEQMSVAQMAAYVMQPKGYRVWFDYEGRLASGLLVPAGLPGTWPIAMMVPRANVRSVDGPSSEDPTSTRIRVIGGEADHPFSRITDDSVWASGLFIGRFLYGRVATVISTGGDVLDLTQTLAFAPPNSTSTISLAIGGPIGEQFRAGASVVSEIRMTTGTIGDFLTAPYVLGGSESYNDTSDRQNATVRFQVHRAMGDPPLDIGFDFDVAGHATEYVYPRVYVQHWNDALIDRFGQLKGEVEGPAVWNWNDAHLVAVQEMAIATLSENRARVLLERLDLRIEAGDVVTIEDPGGGAFKLWVREVQHGVTPSRGSTQLSGYVVA
ncbi:MAG TPA: hypothetical protein VM238_00125 [Phycisphaerae bacterium]|nr:hypothetical protein [Phycisphaerae bacterium]